MILRDYNKFITADANGMSYFVSISGPKFVTHGIFHNFLFNLNLGR